MALAKAVEPEAESTLTPPPPRAGPVDEQGNEPHWYWPFATAGLYNWRIEHSRFSDNPKELIGLLDTSAHLG
jgi:hypothetical protein